MKEKSLILYDNKGKSLAETQKIKETTNKIQMSNFKALKLIHVDQLNASFKLQLAEQRKYLADIAEILELKNVTLEKKQELIEELTQFTVDDLFSYYPTEPELEMLPLIKKLLFNENLSMWKPKNIAKLCLDLNFEPSSRSVWNKYQFYYDYFLTSEKLIESEIGLIVLYALRSTINKLLIATGINEISLLKFVVTWGKTLIQLFHLATLTKKHKGIIKLYYKIKNDENQKKFFFAVLTPILYLHKNLDIFLSSVKNNKSPNMIRLSNTFESSEISKCKFIKNHTALMVTEPKNWIWDINSSNLNFGGFKHNKQGLYPGIHNYSKTIYMKISKEVIQCINKLQKESYRVKKSTLNSFTSDAIKLYNLLVNRFEKEFIKKNSKINHLIFKLNETKTQIILLPFEETKYKGTKVDDIYVDKFNPEGYDQSMDLIFNIFLTLDVAHLFSDYKLYCPWFYCFRFRLYSTGNPINAIGDSLTRLLFELNANKPTKYDSQTQGITLIGLVMGCERILLSTGAIEDSNSTEKKPDFYTQINNSIKSKLNSMSDNDFEVYVKTSLDRFKQNIEKKNKNVKDSWLKNWNYKIFLRLIELIKDYLTNQRVFVKLLVMCISYNETDYGRYQRIINMLNNNLHKVGLDNAPYICIWVTSELINTLLKEVLNHISPNILLFMSLFNHNAFKNAIKTNQFVRLQNEFVKVKYIRPVYDIVKQRSVKIHRGVNSYAPISAAIRIPNKKKDQTKGLLISNAANYIHNKDSCLNIANLMHFQKLKLPISSLHDCWQVQEKDYPVLLEIYKKNLIKYVLNSKYDLTYYFLSNNVDINLIKTELDLITKNKKKLLKNLKTKKFNLSSNLLKEE